MVTLREEVLLLPTELQTIEAAPYGLTPGPQAEAELSSVLEHLRRSNALYDAGDFAEALRECDAVLALHPGLAEAYHNRGVAQGRLERYQEALAAYDLALALGLDNDATRLARAAVLKKLLRGLAAGGRDAWLGYPPRGSNPPIVLKPGPSVSDAIIEDRRWSST